MRLCNIFHIKNCYSSAFAKEFEKRGFEVRDTDWEFQIFAFKLMNVAEIDNLSYEISKEIARPKDKE